VRAHSTRYQQNVERGAFVVAHMRHHPHSTDGGDGCLIRFGNEMHLEERRVVVGRFRGRKHLQGTREVQDFDVVIDQDAHGLGHDDK